MCRGMIRLVPFTAALADAAIAGDDALRRALGHDVVEGWASFREALAPTRDALATTPNRSAWGARFFVTEDSPQLVGWGGFKAPPAAGVVEVGYEIAKSCRGRGLATAAVAALVDEAFAHPEIDTVIAHTLTEHNASNRILEKLGFRHDGYDTEDGQTVWRYALRRRA